jgi:uncharacterized membrane protein YgcG
MVKSNKYRLRDPQGKENFVRYKTRLFHCFIIAVAFAAFLLLGAFAVTGTVYGYTTPEFNVNIDAHIDHSYSFTEEITVDFGNYGKHGIYRNIPLDSKYRITDISVDDDEYDVYTESGNQVIQIGSADYRVTGEHTYVIHYTIQELEDNDSTADYLSLDVLLTGWDSSIDRAHVTLNLPDGLKFESLDYYTGQYSSDTNNYGTWNKSGDKITFVGYDLPEGVGATVNGVLPDGTWVGALSYNWVRVLVLIGIVLCFLLLLALRITWGRNPEVIETVEFYPPEGLTPVDIGYIIDGNVDDNDITATFFYLADQGYIDIYEYKKNEFEFTRLGNLPETEKPSIRRFYRGLFGSTAFDDYEEVAQNQPKKLKAKTKKIGKRMATAYRDIPRLVDDDFSGKHKLYTSRSKLAKIIGMAIFFLVTALTVFVLYALNSVTPIWMLAVSSMIIGSAFLLLIIFMSSIYDYRMSRKPVKSMARMALALGIYVIAVFVYMYNVCLSSSHGYNDRWITTLMLGFFVVAPFLIFGMDTRTEWSNELYGKVLGFRNFIRDAELERIEALAEENPSYFYNVLPYAYVFGMTKKWASKFESIAVEKPTWYSSYGDTSDSPYFDVVMMDSMLNHVSGSVRDTINLSSSKDSGGGGGAFSSGGGGGGGFSGGGSGGGGGGAW